jgi:hypothetical protein
MARVCGSARPRAHRRPCQRDHPRIDSRPPRHRWRRPECRRRCRHCHTRRMLAAAADPPQTALSLSLSLSRSLSRSLSLSLALSLALSLVSLRARSFSWPCPPLLTIVCRQCMGSLVCTAWAWRLRPPSHRCAGAPHECSGSQASLVVGLLGAALGSLLIYSLPPVLHLLVGAAPLRSLAGVADVALVLLGLVLAVLGTRTALAGDMPDVGAALPANVERMIRRFARRRERKRKQVQVRRELVFDPGLSKAARAQVRSEPTKERIHASATSSLHASTVA